MGGTLGHESVVEKIVYISFLRNRRLSIYNQWGRLPVHARGGLGLNMVAYTCHHIIGYHGLIHEHDLGSANVQNNTNKYEYRVKLIHMIKSAPLFGLEMCCLYRRVPYWLMTLTFNFQSTFPATISSMRVNLIVI